MKIDKKEVFSNLGTATLIFAVVVFAMAALGYIDVPAIIKIYLPIFLIGICAMVFGQIYFTHILFTAAELGLVMEYFISSANNGRPNMMSGFLNTILITLGVCLGVIAQILYNKQKAKKK